MVSHQNILIWIYRKNRQCKVGVFAGWYFNETAFRKIFYALSLSIKGRFVFALRREQISYLCVLVFECNLMFNLIKIQLWIL